MNKEVLKKVIFDRHKLIIVTYDEDKTLEIEGKIIEVISLKNFLLKDL